MNGWMVWCSIEYIKVSFQGYRREYVGFMRAIERLLYAICRWVDKEYSIHLFNAVPESFK
jgi:hypothetical protein